jgi:hypothetical protein
MASGETILVIPDMHIPAHHIDSFQFLEHLKSKWKPTRVICIGDEIDCHAISRWPHNPDGYSAGHELDQAIFYLQDLYKMFPNVGVCTSNHTIRPFIKAMEAGLPKRILRDYHEILDAPKGWEWRDKWIIDDILFEHGENSSGQNGAITAARQNMQSTVIGHIHSFAGITYLASSLKLIFAFNVGCLIDIHSYAMKYGAKIRNKPILGAGIIKHGVPIFEPMTLNGRGRWMGKT